MAAFDVGDVVAVPSSCYPCYRNLLATYGCSVLSIAVDSNCAPLSLSRLHHTRRAPHLLLLTPPGPASAQTT